jgi:HEAT repeat protein
MCGDLQMTGPVRLEGPTALLILVRIDNGQLDQLRVSSPDCRLDPGGLPLHSLTGVPASESVAWLKSQVTPKNPNRAIMAISLHAGPEALAVLIDEAKNDKAPQVRSKALFWLAQKAADKQTEEVIRNAVVADPDLSVKEQAVFALNQLPPDRGVPLLIEVAKNNPDPAVRKKAMFWLGQSKDPRALDFFAQVLR